MLIRPLRGPAHADEFVDESLQLASPRPATPVIALALTRLNASQLLAEEVSPAASQLQLTVRRPVAAAPVATAASQRQMVATAVSKLQPVATAPVAAALLFGAVGPPCSVRYFPCQWPRRKIRRRTLK